MQKSVTCDTKVCYLRCKRQLLTPRNLLAYEANYKRAVIKNSRKSLAVSYKRRIFAEKRDKMTQQNRKLPLGIQDFEEMRRDHYIYADKTDMVWKLANGTKYNYLSRPRRFGKSLLCSTLKCYFEGRKDLFEGLKMMELETEWVASCYLS